MAWARAAADHSFQAGSSVTISRITLESTRVTGRPAMAVRRPGGSVATQQLHELIGPHGVAVLDDVDLVDWWADKTAPPAPERVRML
jgi:hypothetical protein